MEPVEFMTGPNRVEANPIVVNLPNSRARPVAKPEFCMPTSMQMVRVSSCESLNNLAQ